MTSDKFIFRDDDREVKIKFSPRPGKEIFFTHTLRRPTFAEEEAREMGMMDITKQAGKVEGQQAVQQASDDSLANVKLYDKIAVSVEGYKINGSKEKVNVDAEVNGSKILDLIPTDHKSTAIWGMWSGSFDIDMDEDALEDFEFELGAVRDWTIVQKIGGQYLREDGTPAPPDYVIPYTLREPTEKERKRYRLEASNSNSYMNKDGARVIQSSVNLKVLSDLFDNLIVSVDALVESDSKPVEVKAEGEEVKESKSQKVIPFDVKSKEHLSMIPATYKKTAVIRLFNALESDLGN